MAGKIEKTEYECFKQIQKRHGGKKLSRGTLQKAHKIHVGEVLKNSEQVCPLDKFEERPKI